MAKPKLIPITVHLPREWLEGLDELVEAEMYPNRAEAIRMAVRDLINKELPIARQIFQHRLEAQHS